MLPLRTSPPATVARRAFRLAWGRIIFWISCQNIRLRKVLLPTHTGVLSKRHCKLLSIVPWNYFISLLTLVNRWNANNTQQTLPSIPSLLDDSFANNSQPPPPSSSSVYNNNKSNNINASNNLNTLSASTSMPKASGGAIMQQQQHQQQSQNPLDDVSSISPLPARRVSNN